MPRLGAGSPFATDGPTAKAHQPVLLWRQGKHTAERLRSADFKEPEKKGAGMSLDPKAMADKLEPAVDRLYAAYQAVALERRKLETTVDGKKETFSEFDRRFRAAVRFGVAMCLLADEPYLASKLNTAQLQRRHSSATGEESSPFTPDEGSPPSASPSPPSAAAKSRSGQPQGS